MGQTRSPGILFTGFEPSGDDHASAVIAELRKRYPDPNVLPIYAWGGPKMQAAGAELIERTGQSAVMGVPGLGKIIEHIKIHRRIDRWMRQGKATLHVPVDSPAANFPVCKIAKKRGMKVLHLVAPQVWAWASWRIKKLRKRTDLVLCLLPFEQEWFQTRGVQAKFVGHPLYDYPLDMEEVGQQAAKLPVRSDGTNSGGGRDAHSGTPKLAIMPGSRPAEMVRCFPILLDAFVRLRRDFPHAIGMVAATTPEAVRKIERIAAAHGGWPAGLGITHDATDAIVHWCDFALVVSGTVTLQIARQRKPMVVVYSPGWLMYHLIVRWLVSTELFALPNLIAGRRIVPEFIPHFGDGEAIAVEVIKLMRRPGYADDQRVSLEAVVRRFGGKNASVVAADEIEKMLGLKRTS